MRARTNGVELEYEIFGDKGEPLLLIMGLGSQMIYWDERFCHELAQAGFRVIRFDNRDVGLSSKIEQAGRPDIVAAFQALQAGKPVVAPYTLVDMARDTIGLLDALDIPRAHIVGASMGGMIAQEMALAWPDRVKSLASLLSTTGERDLPGPTPAATAVLFEPPPHDRQGFMDRAVRVYRAIGSVKLGIDEAWLAERAGRAFDRCYYPVGFARQLVAVWATPGRRQRLGSLKVPTVVIHGREDPLVPAACAEDTARAIPGAELVVIDDMGHDLPPTAWPRMIEAIRRNAARA